MGSSSKKNRCGIARPKRKETPEALPLVGCFDRENTREQCLRNAQQTTKQNYNHDLILFYKIIMNPSKPHGEMQKYYWCGLLVAHRRMYNTIFQKSLDSFGTPMAMFLMFVTDLPF